MTFIDAAQAGIPAGDRGPGVNDAEKMVDGSAGVRSDWVDKSSYEGPKRAWNQTVVSVGGGPTRPVASAEPMSRSSRRGARRPSRLTVSNVDETLLVQERGQLLEFSYTDMLCYAGPYSPAGVATAFKVMQRAFAALSPNQPPQRRAIVIRTAFQGPGARDGFEAVTRAVTDGRYTVDPGLARNDRGRLLQNFVFQLVVAGRTATLLLRPGFVTAEFIDLAGKSDRNPTEEASLDQLKAQLAERLLAVPAEDVYDVAE